MRVSVSLASNDIDFIDHYARQHQITRADALHAAVQLLRNHCSRPAAAEPLR